MIYVVNISWERPVAMTFGSYLGRVRHLFSLPQSRPYFWWQDISKRPFLRSFCTSCKQNGIFTFSLVYFNRMLLFPLVLICTNWSWTFSCVYYKAETCNILLKLDHCLLHTIPCHVKHIDGFLLFTRFFLYCGPIAYAALFPPSYIHRRHGSIAGFPFTGIFFRYFSTYNGLWLPQWLCSISQPIS